MLYWHYQHFASGRLVVHWRYCEAVASLQLVKTGGETFSGACHDGVRLLLSARSVLAITCFGELSVDLVSDLRIFSF